MTETPNHPPGTFCWVDLATTDTAAAKSFYAAVLGWTATDVPTDMGPPYTMFALGDQGVCGAYPLAPGSGDHPHWLSYVGVADLDAIVARAQGLGAQVAMPPMDVMEEGRLAVIRDPTGAHLGLWQPAAPSGLGALTTSPGPRPGGNSRPTTWRAPPPSTRGSSAGPSSPSRAMRMRPRATGSLSWMGGRSAA